jgi:hypothetical protein
MRSCNSVGNSSSFEVGYDEETVVWEELLMSVSVKSGGEDAGEEEEGDWSKNLSRSARAPFVGVSTEPGVLSGDTSGRIGR